MLVDVASLLFVFTQAVFSKTSNFKHKKETLKLSNHQYLTTTTCTSPVRCAGACLSTPGCVLADLDFGNLYKKAQAQNLKTNVTVNYVEQNVDEQEKIGKSFLMVSINRRRLKVRSVYKILIRSMSTYRTSIHMTETIVSIAYDRYSNTLFWSEQSGIFKQVVESNSMKKKISNQMCAKDLNIYNGQLVFRPRTHRNRIYAHNPLKSNSDRLLLDVKNPSIDNLVIDGNIACWNTLGSGVSINCVEMPSGRKLFTQSNLNSVIDVDLFITANYGMLIYVEAMDRYCIRVVNIVDRKRFEKPKALGYYKYKQKLSVAIAPGFLSISVCWFNKVDILQINKDGSLAEESYSFQLPDYDPSAYTISVLFL